VRARSIIAATRSLLPGGIVARTHREANEAWWPDILHRKGDLQVAWATAGR
jgi:hypothetical protein